MPKRDEVIQKWRKLQNEERNDLHSSPNTGQVIIETNEVGRACNTYVGE